MRIVFACFWLTALGAFFVLAQLFPSGQGIMFWVSFGLLVLGFVGATLGEGLLDYMKKKRAK